jgi:hypothetical protein
VSEDDWSDRRDSIQRARARSEALRLLSGHATIKPIVGRQGTEWWAHIDEDLTAVRSVLSSLSVPQWGWLIEGVRMTMMSRRLPYPPTDPDMDGPAIARQLLVEDASADRVLAEDVYVTPGFALLFFEAGTSEARAHRRIETAAWLAHLRVRTSSQDAKATAPGARLGKVEEWALWWYRVVVLQEDRSSVARDSFPGKNAKNNRSTMNLRIREVGRLLAES